jgi:prolyl-tRNA editing enzyme YbaK/EbsC (Cys-tRNA(Pro) deacylase)
MPVYAEKTIFGLQKIYINGGKRGFIVEISSEDLQRILPIVQVEAALKER